MFLCERGKDRPEPKAIEPRSMEEFPALAAVYARCVRRGLTCPRNICFVLTGDGRRNQEWAAIEKMSPAAVEKRPVTLAVAPNRIEPRSGKSSQHWLLSMPWNRPVTVTPAWLYVCSECPHPVDAPVVADGLPVRADRASRGCGHSLLTYSQPGVTPILEAMELLTKVFFNTRTGWGTKNAHPSGFSRIAGKRRRAAPPFFSVPAHNWIWHLV